MDTIAQLLNTEPKYIYLALFLVVLMSSMVLGILYWIYLDACHDYGTKSLDEKTRNTWIFEEGQWSNYVKQNREERYKILGKKDDNNG
ncbi:phi29 gene 17 homologue [Bacillus phage GA1]|uniref:Phi29 gene 17 homologue n=1 Tax=Bacillus phage GA-1 TaxID=2679898 RepID=Q9FZU7_BPGA1|nr:phi29 gene 17 homologue [Bacillus phage GA1]CAC21549.1 phi29 gene 17 homologue [Bacillus phage GA1]